jgi:catechol 2,3-dioxygenase-like lactoylglutathione lyase family enzyme
MSFSRRHFVKRAVTAAVGGPLIDATRVSAQGAGRVRAFDHVALPMQDTAAMTSFYKALGFAVEESAQLLTIHFGDQKIHFHAPSLWQRQGFTLRGPAAKPGCGDLCFVWEGTPEALKALLAHAGATVEEGPVKRPGGRDGGKAIGTSTYVRDPDQNLLEFMIYL